MLWGERCRRLYLYHDEEVRSFIFGWLLCLLLKFADGCWGRGGTTVKGKGKGKGGGGKGNGGGIVRGRRRRMFVFEEGR